MILKHWGFVENLSHLECKDKICGHVLRVIWNDEQNVRHTVDLPMGFIWNAEYRDDVLAVDHLSLNERTLELYKATQL